MSNEPNAPVVEQPAHPLAGNQLAPAAPFLFSEMDAVEATRERKAAGNYTAAELKAEEPLIYNAVLEYLKAGVGLLKIAAAFRVHHRTAAAIRDENLAAIDIARSKMVTDLRTAAQLQLEHLIENPGLVPWNVKGLVISQLIDKAELLDGRATSRSEIVAPERPIRDALDWEERIRMMPTEKQLSGSDVWEIGSGGGNFHALEGAGSAELQPPGGQRSPARTDAESEGCGDTSEASEGQTTAQAPVQVTPEASPAPVPDARNRPPGGGSRDEGDAQESIDPASQKFSANRPADP